MSRSLLSCRNLLLSVLALLLVGPLAGRAHADPLTLLSNGAGADVTITYTDSSIPGGGYTLTGFAGQNNLQLGSNPAIIGFCVDLAHFVSVGQTYSVTGESTANLTNGSQIAFLVNTYGSTNLSNVQAAGLQIAIWSELYDNGAGFTSGNFQFTASENSNDPNYSQIADWATTFLIDAQNGSSTSTWFDASPSGNSQWRGQSMVVADPPPATVPEPPMFAIFSIGLIFLGLFHWWVQRSCVARSNRTA